MKNDETIHTSQNAERWVHCCVLPILEAIAVLGRASWLSKTTSTKLLRWFARLLLWPWACRKSLVSSVGFSLGREKYVKAAGACLSGKDRFRAAVLQADTLNCVNPRDSLDWSITLESGTWKNQSSTLLLESDEEDDPPNGSYREQPFVWLQQLVCVKCFTDGIGCILLISILVISRKSINKGSPGGSDIVSDVTIRKLCLWIACYIILEQKRKIVPFTDPPIGAVPSDFNSSS